MTRVRAERADQRRLAARDPLTGLPLRATIEAHIAGRLGAPVVAGFALVVLDVDGFQQINAAFGYLAGDRLLVNIGRRLAACGPAAVARLGADRFAAVVSTGVEPGGARAAAARLVTAARGARETPATGSAGAPDTSVVGVCAGVATYPEHGQDAATLLRRAESALAEAKRRGDGDVGVPAGDGAGPDGAGPDGFRLLAGLRRVVCDPTDQGLRMYYQPQVDPRTGTVVGAEAMPRWHLPGRSPLDPTELFRVAGTGQLADRSGVSRLLASRVLDDVIAQLARWGEDVAGLRVSVNVTMSDLTGPDLVDRLADRLVERGVPASRLQLEVTESVAGSDRRTVLAVLSRLQRLGVSVALDHFGTGAASLALLRRLPLAEVKIDRSFVLGVAGDEADAAVVRAVVALANDLGLRVVADGVEDEPTWRALSALGCVTQGWYCARPMPPERLVNWIALYRDRLRPQLT